VEGAVAQPGFAVRGAHPSASARPRRRGRRPHGSPRRAGSRSSTCSRNARRPWCQTARTCRRCSTGQTPGGDLLRVVIPSDWSWTLLAVGSGWAATTSRCRRPPGADSLVVAADEAGDSPREVFAELRGLSSGAEADLVSIASVASRLLCVSARRARRPTSRGNAGAERDQVARSQPVRGPGWDAPGVAERPGAVFATASGREDCRRARRARPAERPPPYAEHGDRPGFLAAMRSGRWRDEISHRGTLQG
jgi:hypothetical protein